MLRRTANLAFFQALCSAASPFERVPGIRGDIEHSPLFYVNILSLKLF